MGYKYLRELYSEWYWLLKKLGTGLFSKQTIQILYESKLVIHLVTLKINSDTQIL